MNLNLYNILAPRIVTELFIIYLIFSWENFVALKFKRDGFFLELCRRWQDLVILKLLKWSLIFPFLPLNESPLFKIKWKKCFRHLKTFMIEFHTLTFLHFYLPYLLFKFGIDFSLIKYLQVFTWNTYCKEKSYWS